MENLRLTYDTIAQEGRNIKKTTCKEQKQITSTTLELHIGLVTVRLVETDLGR